MMSNARFLATGAISAAAGAFLACVVPRLRAMLRTRLLDKSAILALRRQHFCAAQSVSYANTDPLLIVRGQGATLTDESGRTFLDSRNNVAHVGHACGRR